MEQVREIVVSRRPGGAKVPCPDCGAMAWAIIPRTASIVEGEEDADGKVRVNCHECGNRFLAYYKE